MYSETPWIYRLVLELQARGLVEAGDPVVDCRAQSPAGQRIAEEVFLLQELHDLRPRFSFKGSHLPQSEGLEQVLDEVYGQAAFLRDRLNVPQQPLPAGQLAAIDALEQTLVPPPAFGDDEQAADRWRQALVFQVFAAFSPMFKWPDGPWRERLPGEFAQLGYSADEFAAVERFVAPYEGRELEEAKPTLSAAGIGPRQRLSPLAARLAGPEREGLER